jgi:hypothetical protein
MVSVFLRFDYTPLRDSCRGAYRGRDTPRADERRGGGGCGRRWQAPRIECNLVRGGRFTARTSSVRGAVTGFRTTLTSV